MSRFWIAAVAVPAFNFALATTAFADSAAEAYIDEALPLMHYSCASLVEEAAGDQNFIDMVVRALVAVSLYNRGVEKSWFDVDDQKTTALHDKFVEGLKKGCEEDTEALLAGVVDRAVADALWEELSK